MDVLGFCCLLFPSLFLFFPVPLAFVDTQASQVQCTNSFCAARHVIFDVDDLSAVFDLNLCDEFVVAGSLAGKWRHPTGFVRETLKTCVVCCR